MELERLREKKKVFGKRRITLIAVILLIGLFLAFAISSLGSCEEQMSEGVIRKSPLVWRADEGGDYLLSQMSPNETYELTNPSTSEGRIKTITATWKFKGEVGLAVSANNGVDYTPVVNGTPLPILDANSGNQLKWKVTLGSESELTEVRITYTDAKDVLSTFGNPQLSGFKFRKLLHISNPSGRELFNYQLKIKVGESAGVVFFDAHCEGNVQADFKDVRFTAADGETPLSYYFENIIGDTPICSATYYVKIPQLPKQGLNIYLYYANSDARDRSDAESVFDFFDHFNGELDSAKWDSQTNFEGECYVSNSFLKLDAAKIISKSYQFKDGIIEYRAKAEVGYEIRAIIREDKEKIERTQLVYSSAYEGAEHSVAVGDIVKANALEVILPQVFYDFRVIANGANITFERYGLGYNELETSVNFQDSGGLIKGYIGLEVGGVGSGENITYYDWLRVRKFVEDEPYISASGEEEEINLAKFSNTTIADDGDVVLDSTEGFYSLSGRYTTAPLFTACNITAITPTIKKGLAPFSIDISADGGASWREGCVSGRTYSAPLDFTVGRELLLRANLSIEDTNTTSELEELKLEYSVAPIVSSANIHCSGAAGVGGVYKLGDAIVVEWDNSAQGDNNPDILSVSCNFEPFGGNAQTRMLDDNDNIYTARYELPEGIKTTANIFIIAANFCGAATRDGHILTVDTTAEEEVPLEEVEAEEAAPSLPGVEGVLEEILDAEKLAATDSSKDVVIDGDVTISTIADISSKTLTIGDGTGLHTSRLILYHDIDPNTTAITIRKGGELIQANASGQSIAGDLIIESGGLLTHLENNAKKLYQINFTAQNIILKPYGVISVQAKGYAGGDSGADGKGKSRGRYVRMTASGGSHGGRGGGTERYGLKAEIYGRYREPQDLGSGGAGSFYVKGGRGAGVIKLTARENFSISGRINADGQDGEQSFDDDYDAGGGAAGSIYLQAGKFSGSGAEITAHGGSGHISGGGGGGGRIHIKAPAGKISGTLNANGGQGCEEGRAGSVIIE